ncbi:hypothetical protein [Myxococcus sp. CA056]|uniref:hypothetical protein n=1 Tax=Myxococcus sp. CA056 TaxID=2741740 RepID=UPI001C2DE293|nr:hypothetical protein [Myxococcus sp. CA056]
MIKTKPSSLSPSKLRQNTPDSASVTPPKKTPSAVPAQQDAKVRNPSGAPSQAQRPTDGFEGRNPAPGGRGTRALDALSNVSGAALPAMETLSNVSGAALPAMQAFSPMMAGGQPAMQALSPMMAGGLPSMEQLSPMNAPMRMGGMPAMDTLSPMNAPMPRGLPSMDGLPQGLGLPTAPPMMTPNMLEGMQVPSLPGLVDFAPRGLPSQLQDFAPPPSLQDFAPPPSLQDFAPPPSLQEPVNPAPRGLPPQLRDFAPAREATPRAAPQAEPESSGIPSANDKRPAGDKRSAAQIVDDSPALKNLGRQKDIKFDQLCKQTGIDPKLDLKDAKQNPDAVFRLAKVLEFIDSAKASTGGDRDSKVKNGKGDGNIEGITKSGDARHGTEAGMVKDFAEQGYSFLGEQKLPTTKDTHVKADGSNKDNFQWAAGEAGKHLWFLPAVSNVLTGIGNSEGGAKGVFEGAAKGYVNTLKGAAEGVLGAVTTGRVNPASLLLGGAAGALANTEAAPQPVKDIASML